MSERVQTELQRRTSDAEFQAEFLAADVVEHLLNLGSMSMNGYTFTPPEVLNDVPDDNRFYPSFGRTRQRIVEGCYHIIHKHGAEIEQECMRVPICDEQLYSNVEDALSTIWQVPRNWGRLVSLFVTAYYLCMRICKEEGKDSSKIQSVIGWLARFLKKNAVPWVVERGGFVSDGESARELVQRSSAVSRGERARAARPPSMRACSRLKAAQLSPAAGCQPAALSPQIS